MDPITIIGVITSGLKVLSIINDMAQAGASVSQQQWDAAADLRNRLVTLWESLPQEHQSTTPHPANV